MGCVGWSHNASARSLAVSAAPRFSEKSKRAACMASSSSLAFLSWAVDAPLTAPTQAQASRQTSSKFASPTSVRSTLSSKSWPSRLLKAVPQLRPSIQPRSRRMPCKVWAPSWPRRWETRSSGVDVAEAPRKTSRGGSGQSSCKLRHSRTGTMRTTRGVSLAAQGATAAPFFDTGGPSCWPRGTAPKRPSPLIIACSSSNDSLPTTLRRMRSPT